MEERISQLQELQAKKVREQVEFKQKQQEEGQWGLLESQELPPGLTSDI